MPRRNNCSLVAIVPTDSFLIKTLDFIQKLSNNFLIKGKIMKKRQKLSKKTSKKMYSKSSNKTHIKNLPKYSMRGGVRM